MFFGICLFIYQLVRYARFGNFKEALDSPMNGVYGLMCAIWSTVF